MDKSAALAGLLRRRSPKLDRVIHSGALTKLAERIKDLEEDIKNIGEDARLKDASTIQDSLNNLERRLNELETKTISSEMKTSIVNELAGHIQSAAVAREYDEQLEYR